MAPVNARQLLLWGDTSVELREALNEEEQIFCDSYLGAGPGGVGDVGSVTKAYQAIRPHARRGTARKVGRDWLLQREHLRAYIEARRREMANAAELQQMEVVGYFRTIARIGLGQERIRKSRVSDAGKVEDLDLYDPNLSAAASAATGLMKFLGVGNDSTTVNLTQYGDALSGLAPEDLAEIRAILERHQSRQHAAQDGAAGNGG